VIGKMSVLAWLLSLITWIPGLILFAIQANLAGWEWTRNNLWIAWALFIGAIAWILILSLVAIAMSAWVKWKIAAGALILAVFFAGAGFGAAINGVMRTNYGTMVDLAQDTFIIWAKLFRLRDANLRLDPLDAANALAAACFICLWLLFKKVRAFEVVK
jgi:ABC-2 type transport system permease protein